MAELEIQLKRIQDKLQQLLKEHTTLQKENSQLRQQVESAEKQASLQMQYAEELKQQVSILKYSAGEMNDAEKKDFEKKINGYLKEIDRCITLLSE